MGDALSKPELVLAAVYQRELPVTRRPVGNEHSGKVGFVFLLFTGAQ